MKTIFSRGGTSHAFLLAGCLLIPAAAEAAQLAYEGFDYPSGTANVVGMNGGSGWNGTWLLVNNGSADVVDGSLAAAANAPAGYDARSIGNSALLPNNRRIGRKLDTSVSGPFASRRDSNGRIGLTGTSVYLSFMQQPNGTSAYYEFEFHRGDLGDGGRIAGIGNDQAGDNVNLRAPNGTHTPIGLGSTEAGFYVVRIDFKDGDDDVYVYRNPTTATEPGTATLVRKGAADLSFDGISFGAFNNGRTVTHDEVRVGDSWADVTVPAVSQPAITRQPLAATSFVGGAVTLQSAASGQPLPTYQWYKGATLLDGQINATLTLTNVQPGDAGTYHVTVTNSQGTATSDPAQVTVRTTPAGLLAYEGFDYETGSGNLPGKTGGLGWGAAWAAINGTGSNVQSGSLPAGTNGPNGYDTQSLGNSNHMPNGQRDGRNLDTSPEGRLAAAGYIDGSGNIGADGKSLYISFLQQPDGTSLFYEFELHRGNLGDPGRIGGVGNDTDAAQISLRTAGTQTLIGPGSTGVNLYVVRIDFKAGNDDVYVYQNPISATEPGTPTLFKADASDMSFNGISLAAFANGRTVKHDEIRLGQSWSDVISGTSRRQLTWLGDGTANNWNLTANNWSAGAGPTAFADGDPVTFDDTGRSPVNVPAPVATSLITAANDLVAYTLAGAGSVHSSGGLIKSGVASFTINAPTVFDASIVVNGGNLTLAGTTSVGGDLNLNLGAGTVTLSGTSTFTGSLNAKDGAQVLSGNNTFSGSLNAATGTQTLSGTNTFSGFVSTSGNLTITGPTTVVGNNSAPVWIGNLPGGDSTLTIENGGSLAMTGAYNDSWVVGRDGGNGAVVQNGGTVTYNPSNRDVAFIGASEKVASTVASYTMNGGTLEMSNVRLGVALGVITAHLKQTGGAINVRQLDLGANVATGTAIYDLTGGVLTVGAGGITSASGMYEMNLASGTLAAAADWQSSLAMNFTAGSMTFDTGSHKVALTGALGGTGGIVKTGTGTLSLSGLGTYSGATTVNAGTLAGSFGNDASALTVASGATLSLGDGGIGNAYFGSATLAAGSTYAVKIDSSSGSADQLAALGPVQINGASATFLELAGGVLPLGTQLTIVESVESNLTGKFAGLAEGAVVHAGANTFTVHYETRRVTLTSVAGSAYSAWAAANGLDASPGKDPSFAADPESDGISNGLEWVLGGDPLVQDGSSLVTFAGTAADGITLHFTREEASIGNATLVVQWDADLDGTWTDIPVAQAGGSYAGGVTVVVDQTATPDAVTVHIPASNAANGKVFARLRATQP